MIALLLVLVDFDLVKYLGVITPRWVIKLSVNIMRSYEAIREIALTASVQTASE